MGPGLDQPPMHRSGSSVSAVRYRSRRRRGECEGFRSRKWPATIPVQHVRGVEMQARIAAAGEDLVQRSKERIGSDGHVFARGNADIILVTPKLHRASQ